jgi:hypothetical protein
LTAFGVRSGAPGPPVARFASTISAMTPLATAVAILVPLSDM